MANGTRQQRRAFWREAVEGWARSRLSKAAYAREHGLAAHQLIQWAARYREWVNSAQAPGATDDRDAASESTRVLTIAADAGSDEQSRAAPAITVRARAPGSRAGVRSWCARKSLVAWDRWQGSGRETV